MKPNKEEGAIFHLLFIHADASKNWERIKR
jgi:hypothetical protein